VPACAVRLGWRETLGTDSLCIEKSICAAKREVHFDDGLGSRECGAGHASARTRRRRRRLVAALCRPRSVGIQRCGGEFETTGLLAACCWLAPAAPQA
jgi:hypothetical protein